MSIGLPISIAILLRSGTSNNYDIRRLVQTPRRSLLLIAATLLIVLLGPLPALTGLVRLASAEGFPWPVDGWIVYAAALLSDAALVGLVWGLFRGRGSSSQVIDATQPSTALPRVKRNPPVGIGFLWDEGVRVIQHQLDSGDALDRKIAPLLALIAPTAAIMATQASILGDTAPLLIIELLVAAVLLLWSFWTRSFDAPPRLEGLVPYARATQLQIQARFISNLVLAQQRNQRALTSKQRLLRGGLVALTVFLLTLFVALYRVAGKGGT
jgi:hypothetical protein